MARNETGLTGQRPPLGTHGAMGPSHVEGETVSPDGREVAWALLNATNEMALLLQVPDFEVIALNHAMASTLRLTDQAIIGSVVFDHFPPEVAKTRREMAETVVRTKLATRFIDRRDARYLLSSVCPLFDANGEVAQIAVFVRDITELKKSEETDRLAALGKLSAGVAHEFNNLMSAQLLAARMMESKDCDPALADLLDLIVRTTTAGRDICSNLMSFAQTRESQVCALQIEQPIEAALRLCHQHLETARISVVRRFGLCAHEVEGDAGQLQHLFMNLFLNACHAMPEGGELTVQTKRDRHADRPDEVVVSVADTGEGIAPGDLPYIFDPFFTTKGATDSVNPGAGLGLSVCHGIVKSHGGEITVVSAPGQGAKFTFRLQACDEAVVTVPETAAAQHDTAPTPRLHGRILIAEDQPDLRKLLNRLLKAEGCEPVLVTTTTAAIEALDTGPFDAVVTDVLMPGGGGLCLIDAVRALPQPPPILIITGSTDASVVEELLARGASACLLKPFELSDFRQTLAQLLEQGQGG